MMLKKGDRIRVIKLLEDAEMIEAATGTRDVTVGLTGVITNPRLSESAGYVEVKLDRAGEELAFHQTELKLEGGRL